MSETTVDLDQLPAEVREYLTSPQYLEDIARAQKEDTPDE